MVVVGTRSLVTRAQETIADQDWMVVMARLLDRLVTDTQVQKIGPY